MSCGVSDSRGSDAVSPFEMKLDQRLPLYRCCQVQHQRVLQGRGMSGCLGKYLSYHRAQPESQGIPSQFVGSAVKSKP